MAESKAWDWKAEENNIWVEPSEESYYYAEKWKREDRKKVLDLGCGLGRHSVLFSKYGFDVYACDLSEYAVEATEAAVKKLGLNVNTAVCDMLNMPYEDNSFDCIFSYLVISHTDTKGFEKVLSEIKRILKPNGAIFITLCAKDTDVFSNGTCRKIDENTIVKDDNGPEKGIPHFFLDYRDVLKYFEPDFNLNTVRHIDNCCANERIVNSKHYYVFANLK